jgi:1-aminocyclopropane-1-carboxylate deaminase
LSQEDADGAYFLSEGASGNPGAGIGYAKWVFDMLEKESALREDGVLQGSGIFDTIIVACATGGTLAGIIAGMRLAERDGYVNPRKRRHLIGVETFAKDPLGQRDIVVGIAKDTASLIELRREDLGVEDVVVDGRWTAGGYGIYDELTRQTIKMVARTEAMLLDPVYTGKAMTAVVEGIRTGELHGNILFVHTGGSPVLPAYLGIEQD